MSRSRSSFCILARFLETVSSIFWSDLDPSSLMELLMTVLLTLPSMDLIPLEIPWKLNLASLTHRGASTMKKSIRTFMAKGWWASNHLSAFCVLNHMYLHWLVAIALSMAPRWPMQGVSLLKKKYIQEVFLGTSHGQST